MTRTQTRIVGVIAVFVALVTVGLTLTPAVAHTTDETTNTFDWFDDEETFDSATAEVTDESWSGKAEEVTFRFDAPRGELVRLSAGDEVTYKYATGGVREVTVDLDGFFTSGERYPVDVSAKILGGERCRATIERGDGVVTLCGAADDGEPAYDVSVDSNSPVTEGEVLTVEGTVENVGDAAGTEDVTVEVDGQSETRTVTLDPGESATVTLDWQTQSGDAGDYTATVSAAGQTASTAVSVEQAGDGGDGDQPATRAISGYVVGNVGYLDTNVTDPNVAPIEFPECANGEPTQAALDASPDYLPDPGCIQLEGTIDEETGTWNGNITFPLSISEVDSTLGETYVATEITAPDGASGEIDLETGEMTLETTVDISVDIYNVDWGTPWAERGDPINDDTCHIPDVALVTTTGQSGDLTGEPLDATNGTATLVGNEFAIGGAQDCGTYLGVVPLNDAINDEQGIPTDPGQSEVVFDFDFDIQD